ncbi:hypothetical protein CL617_04650 [archaeon]|nr:hypothetical protein [archaeon]|tara:strand:+ start:5630 stop:5956 length:327 start_codon:yes stop_codon:yes gene_type:complete
MELLRAINPSEFTEFIELNSLENKEDLKEGERYLFKINEKSLWFDKSRKINVISFANTNRITYCGIVLEFSAWFLGKYFKKDLEENGKYYCIREHEREVEVIYNSNYK